METPTNVGELIWRPIGTAPEDEEILIAATPDWVSTAWYVNDEDEGTIWYWNRYDRIHPNLVPIMWMPLPSYPMKRPEGRRAQKRDWRTGGVLLPRKVK